MSVAVILVALLAIAVGARLAGLRFGRPARVFGPLPKIEPVHSPLLAKDGNVYLYVFTNEFEPPAVDICVKIDGQIAVHDVFEHDLMTTLTRYRLRLAPGRHRISAISERGQASLEETIEVADELHVSVGYFYGQGTVFIPEIAPCFYIHTDRAAWIPDWGWKERP